MTEDVSKRLETKMSGQPQLRPKEQACYLGNFRERVLLVFSFDNIHQLQQKTQIKAWLQAYQEYQLYINSHLSPKIQTQAVSLAQYLSCPFTIVEQPNTQEAYAVVIATSYAVNKEQITLPLPDTSHPAELKKEKHRLKKLFHKS